jgi:hypothetical protein
LNLVRNEEDTVLVADGTQPFEERGRGGDVPALTKHGLHDYRGRICGCRLLHKEEI